jgi:hypothetical protein
MNLPKKLTNENGNVLYGKLKSIGRIMKHCASPHPKLCVTRASEAAPHAEKAMPGKIVHLTCQKEAGESSTRKSPKGGKNLDTGRVCLIFGHA